MAVPRKLFTLMLLAAGAIYLAGCGGASYDSGSEGPPPVAHTEHDHPDEGPHHGHLIELGEEEYHAELTHDDATSTVTIYILDAAAKAEVPVAEDAVTLNMVVDGAPKQFPMQAVSPADGKASQFQVVDAALLAALESEAETSGKLNVTINGTPYVGEITHHAHGEHAHDHEHEH